MKIAGSLTVPSRLNIHFMAVMIRLSGDAAFSFRICVITLRPNGDSGGSVWATSMSTTSPLLSPQASSDTTEGGKLARVHIVRSLPTSLAIGSFPWCPNALGYPPVTSFYS